MNERAAAPVAPYPLASFPKKGVVTFFGGGRKVLPLPAQEYDLAKDLRAAALGGDDFRGMMQSIRAAGFHIRPLIHEKEEEPGYSLDGFSFSRDGLTVSASQAGMRIIENPANPRAPRLPEDGPYLVGLRESFIREMGPAILQRKRFLDDLRSMVGQAHIARELAALLAANGVEAKEEWDQVSEDGFLSRRRMVSLARDGVEICVSGKNGVAQRVGPGYRSLANAANRLLDLKREMQEPPAAEVTHPEP